LAHSSPRSSPGANAPNPWAGGSAVIRINEIHRDLHWPFGSHRGIGQHLLGSNGGLGVARGVMESPSGGLWRRGMVAAERLA